MREIIGGIIGSTMFAAAWVGLAAFTTWGFDPASWTAYDRGMWGTLFLVVSSLGAVFGYTATISRR